MNQNQDIKQKLNTIFNKSQDANERQYSLSKMKQFAELIKLFKASNENFLFRGQKKSEWKLTSTWLRTKTNVALDYPHYRENIFIFNQYMEIIKSQKKNQELDLYKMLIELQHKRDVPTPLIEFTHHISLALYYATRVNNYQEDVALFILNANGKTSEGFKELDRNTAAKIYKYKNNLQHPSRNVMYFVFDSQDWESDEKVYKIIIKKSIVKKIKNYVRENYNVYELIYADLKSDYLSAINSPSDYYFLEGYKKMKNKDIRDAIQDFEKSLSFDPNHIDSLLYYGFSKSIMKKYRVAIESYDKVLAKFPHKLDVYYARGQANDKWGKDKAALIDFDQTIKLGLENFHTYRSRAETRFKLKKFKDAIEDFTKAIEFRPNDDDSYYMLGESWTQLKAYENAIDNYSQAISIEPTYGAAYRSRGEAYHQLKKYEDAIKDFDKVIEIEIQTTNAFSKDKKDLSKEQITWLSISKMWGFNLPSEFSFASRAMSKFEFKDYEGAIADFSEVLKIDSKNNEAYIYRGLAYYYLKNYEKALENLNRAKKDRSDFLEKIIKDRKLNKIFNINDFGVTFNKNN